MEETKNLRLIYIRKWPNIVFGKHWGQRHFPPPFILIYVLDDKEADG